MKRHTFIFLATLILLGAVFLRIADLHRYPPGLHYDEAADMLLSRDIAFHGYNPFPVVAAYSGREALFYYIAAPMLRIFGTNVMATRLTSALLGILTVAATIALGKALARDKTIALMAGAWLAVSGPQVWLTRQGFRTSPQPFLEALGLWLLWIVLRRKQNWLIPAILGGFFSGLTLYVYMAARVIPVWLVLMLALLIIIDARQRGLRLKQAAVFLAALVITAVPIAAYYAIHPDILTDRLSQLAPTADTPTLFQSLLLHLQMFFIKGDPILRYNLDVGRPYFDPISGLLFMIGLGVAIQLLARRSTSLDKMSAAFVLFSPLMIIPSIIAVNGFPPSHMRSVSMVPLIFFLPALGLVYVWRRFAKVDRRMSLMLGILLFVGLGLYTWHDYEVWGARNDVFLDSDGDLNAAGEWLASSAPTDALIYIASDYYEHPTILAHDIQNPERIRWMMFDHLILPPPDRHAIYIFPHNADFSPWQKLIGAFCIQASDAQPYIKCDVPPNTLHPAPSVAQNVNVGGILALRGADLPAVKAGEQTNALLYWQVLQTPDRADIEPVLNVADAWDNDISPRIYPHFEYSNRWLPGEWIIQHIVTQIPTGNAPGDYQFKITWIRHADAQSVPLHDDQGRFAGLWASVKPLPVLAATSPVDVPAGATQFLPGVFAVAPNGIPTSMKQGEHLRFTVNWLVKQQPTNDQPVQVILRQIFNSTFGIPHVLWTGQPVHDTYPMKDWQAPEQIIDRYDVAIPANLQPGEYQVMIAIDQDVHHPAFTSNFNVMGVQRSFDIPAFAHQPNWHFGDSIALAAYDVQPGNGQVTVKLAWKALKIPDQDYTTFIHLTGADGNIFSQKDSQPSRPTTQWVEGEVIVDSYTLPAPSGDYTLSLGLYLQSNGVRLPINGPDGQLLGDEIKLEQGN